MNPRITEGALDKLRPGWRERRAKRKSPWNLLGVLLGFSIALPVWYFLFQTAWWVHVKCYPSHATLQKQFWRGGISARAFVSSFLLLMPLAVPAFVGGFVSANLLVWLIPPARRVLENEAAGDREMTFAGSNTGLAKWGGIASGVAIVLSAIGALTLASLE